jgi:hypothetical protein
MPSRPLRSGSPTTTCRSNRPGRSSAGSSTSGRLVAESNDHVEARIEAVELTQELIEGLLALIAAGAYARAAPSSNRVQFVDEDDRWRRFLGLAEKIAHAAGPDAHEHFDKLGGIDAEELNPGFARHRARQQGLTGAGRTNQHDASRNARAEVAILLGIAQKIHFLLQLGLGGVSSGHLVEGDLGLIAEIAARPGAAEAEHPRLRARSVAGHPPEESDQQQHRKPFDQNVKQPQPGGRRGLDGDMMRLEAASHQVRIAHRRRKDGAKVAVVDRRRGLLLVVVGLSRLRHWGGRFSIAFGAGGSLVSVSSGGGQRIGLAKVPLIVSAARCTLETLES